MTPLERSFRENQVRREELADLLKNETLALAIEIARNEHENKDAALDAPEIVSVRLCTAKAEREAMKTTIWRLTTPHDEPKPEERAEYNQSPEDEYLPPKQ